MIDRLEMLKTRLQNIYALAQASGDEKHFFLWLYDYVKSFDKESELGGWAGSNRRPHPPQGRALTSWATPTILR